VLEHAVRAVAPGATPGQFAQVGGVAYSYDPDLPPGQRIVSAALTDENGTVTDVLVRDGDLVGNPAAGVRVITLNFMADGGDGYPFKTFLDADPVFADRVDLASEDADRDGVLDAGEDLNRNGVLDLAAAVDAGAATFAASSSEQDAMADYIAERYAGTPYDIADTSQAGDERIQNLNARADGVLDGPYDLAGTAGNDLLGGTAGADTISGGLGADTAVGEGGTDLLFGGQGNDLLLGGEGSDYVLAGQGDDTLDGGAGADPFVNGNLGDDLVRGGEGDDRLWGGKGDDTLEGGAGADTLSGDRGDDRLAGGDGADRFVYQPLPPAPTNALQLTPLGTYDHGGFDEGAAETLAYDPATRRLFVSNAEANTLDVLDLSDPSDPRLVSAIPLDAFGGGVNSVAVKNGIVAAAVASNEDGQAGVVAFFDTDGRVLGQKTVGVLPDMLTFTADGSKLLVANEGERVGDPGPDQIDPPGSISIVDLAGGVAQATVTTLGFGGFEAQRAALVADGLRVTPGKSLATDLEPEYITVTPDGTKAYVSIQEANAFAVVDLATKTITAILPLGHKDYSLPGNGFDASDRDGEVAIRNWPVEGIYEPDAIASFQVDGQTYIATANEGDARSDGSDEARLSTLKLDPTRFPNAAELQKADNLGRLNVSKIDGDTDGDGDLDEIVVFGGRSFSIFDADGDLVFDSGDQFEAIVAAAYPNNFNADNGGNAFDDRSDNKGPEPEAIAIGVVGDRTYAFIGLERVGGVMVYDVTDPAQSQFVQYVNNRDFTQDIETAAAGDSGPEVVQFVAASASPTGKPMLLVANEISGTTTVYDISGLGGTSEVAGPGYDVIVDFDMAQDRIVLAAGMTWQLGAAADGDALLTLGDGQRLELDGLTVAQVQPQVADLVLFA
jgi:Ca2+-binding RTX toxin-like protein